MAHSRRRRIKEEEEEDDDYQLQSSNNKPIVKKNSMRKKPIVEEKNLQQPIVDEESPRSASVYNSVSASASSLDLSLSPILLTFLLQNLAIEKSPQMIFAISLRLPHVYCEIHNFQFQSSLLPSLSRNRLPCQITYCRRKLSYTDLASDLATEVAKINTNLIQREEAMKKSREFLFTEFCGFLGLKSEETKRRWKTTMEEEVKLTLVKEFVSEWGFNFQPLSARSVKEMVEEYVNGQNLSAISSTLSLISSLHLDL